MRKNLLATSLILLATLVNAQEFNFQLGKSISKFKYKDSNGVELQNLQSSDNFFMVAEYRLAILKKTFKENLYADLGLGYNRYGATGSDVALDNYYAWDLTYLGINLGLDYEFYKPGKFIFYGKISISPEFLIRGTQTINDQVFDLVGEEDFNTPYTFFRGGLGVKYQVSNQTSIYLQYMGGKSFGFRKDPEKLNIVAHNVGIGVLINLSKKESKSGMTDPVSQQKIAELEDRIDGLALEVEEAKASANEIKNKEAEMVILKDTLANVLFDFDGEGLKVNKREGKVYVTMDNDMLFEPGSWIVADEGVKAVEALGKGLELNPDVSILIEGHTDNQPYKGGGNIKDNWDLSIKRATAIVEILKKNTKINPKNMTAAGRGEHDPIDTNDTTEGRARNRRIEVIITPNLEKASQILDNK